VASWLGAPQQGDRPRLLPVHHFPDPGVRLPRGALSARQPGLRAVPEDEWPWFGALAERGYLVAAVHRGKNLLMTDAVAGLLDPICRAEIERMRTADRGWRRLLDHLAAAGRPASMTCAPSSALSARN
jgi:hypothetical protein